MLQLSRLQKSDPESFFKAADLADDLQIPAPLFSKILHQLAEAGLIESRKGPYGGVRLHRTPKSIAILDIIHALEGPDPFNRCVMGFPTCSSQAPCPMHTYWEKQKKDLHSILSNCSLADWNTIKNMKNLALKDHISTD